MKGVSEKKKKKTKTKKKKKKKKKKRPGIRKEEFSSQIEDY